MFNLGFSEIIVLGVIALVFIGPKQLPEVAKVVGRMLNEWKRATSELTSSFSDNDVFRDWEERKQKYFADLEKPEEPQKDQLEMNLDSENSEDKKS